MLMRRVHRVVAYTKLSDQLNQVLQAYEILKQQAKRDGKGYIVSNAARKVLNASSPLSAGYTIMSQSIFRNHSDHDYYDKECTAHKKLKETTSRVRTDTPMTIVTEGVWPEERL
ncbi:hypothetical protein LTR17_025303 [Elasticomyces elasticus]|nr:hypothetical protein LTR17_025303 [Elasticomyces elasticus]